MVLAYKVSNFLKVSGENTWKSPSDLLDINVRGRIDNFYIYNLIGIDQ